ncbi:unnamed protein product [Effrenium voratum]|uniref:Cyclin-dependent kinase 2 homolog n=1 Tax=Effrenium voratum TaxID=2562239 RepID=A0AA36ITG4_9DINO|nr:unnamed protein product [Effrenium voratum]CAJ1393341.1 unnamed protein product [Effrenium voratum]
MALVLQPIPFPEAAVAPLELLEGRYEALEAIARGSYGQVRRMRDVVTGAVVAVKSSVQFEEEGLSPFSLREMSIQTACQHPNVVKILDFIALPDSVHLVMELMDCNLHEYMTKTLGGAFSEDLKPAFREIVSGVAYCHRLGYIHRDLKPQNILVKHGHYKVTDFGLARKLKGHHMGCGPFTPLVVTLWYRAPELMLFDRESCKYGQGIDIWSLGCILAEMCTGRVLFPGDSEIGTLFKIFQLKGTPRPASWPGVERMGHYLSSFPSWEDTDFAPVLARSRCGHKGLQQILRDMMQYEPRNRCTANALESHVFFT